MLYRLSYRPTQEKRSGCGSAPPRTDTGTASGKRDTHAVHRADRIDDAGGVVEVGRVRHFHIRIGEVELTAPSAISRAYRRILRSPSILV